MFATIAASSSSQGSNPLVAFLPLILIGGIFYFLMIRPQQRRVREQRSLQNSVEVGDEVMTTAGIFGTVTEVDDDEGTVMVEIAPGTRIRMVRSGIARRLTEDDEEYDDEPEEEDQQSP
jgi:preprotein translocase subunit YajC